MAAEGLIVGAIMGSFRNALQGWSFCWADTFRYGLLCCLGACGLIGWWFETLGSGVGCCFGLDCTL